MWEGDQDLRNSVYDGMFAHVFATLTGGAFLTGFALHLGMGEAMIGALAALPFMATLFQIPAAAHLVRHGSRRGLCLRAARMARLAWVPVLLVPLLPLPHAARAAIVLILLTLSYASGSVSFVSWLSWTTDLVPEAIRGRFFGTRNMLCGTAGMAATVLFGHLLDVFRRWGPPGATLGFAVTFAAAVAAGLGSLGFLARISEPRFDSQVSPQTGGMITPLQDPNFRRFLLFALAWGFSVNFASPFLNVHLLRNLDYSYGFVATLTALSAASDLVGMRLWGALSDRVRNKAVIRVCGIVAATLPLGWLALSRDSVLLPLLLYALGGGFWAGINLCTSNLLLRIAPRDMRPLYFSSYSVLAGLGSAAAPLLAGAFLKAADTASPDVWGLEISPIQAIFLASAALRILALVLLRRVTEPEEATLGQLVRVLRSLRGMTTVAGFNYLLHPFLEVSRDLRSRRSLRLQ